MASFQCFCHTRSKLLPSLIGHSGAQTLCPGVYTFICCHNNSWPIVLQGGIFDHSGIRCVCEPIPEVATVSTATANNLGGYVICPQQQPPPRYPGPLQPHPEPQQPHTESHQPQQHYHGFQQQYSGSQQPVISPENLSVMLQDVGNVVQPGNVINFAVGSEIYQLHAILPAQQQQHNNPRTVAPDSILAALTASSRVHQAPSHTPPQQQQHNNPRPVAPESVMAAPTTSSIVHQTPPLTSPASNQTVASSTPGRTKVTRSTQTMDDVVPTVPEDVPLRCQSVPPSIMNSSSAQPHRRINIPLRSRPRPTKPLRELLPRPSPSSPSLALLPPPPLYRPGELNAMPQLKQTQQDSPDLRCTQTVTSHTALDTGQCPVTPNPSCTPTAKTANMSSSLVSQLWAMSPIGHILGASAEQQSLRNPVKETSKFDAERRQASPLVPATVAQSDLNRPVKPLSPHCVTSGGTTLVVKQQYVIHAEPIAEVATALTQVANAPNVCGVTRSLEQSPFRPVTFRQNRVVTVRDRRFDVAMLASSTTNEHPGQAECKAQLEVDRQSAAIVGEVAESLSKNDSLMTNSFPLVLHDDGPTVKAKSEAFDNEKKGAPPIECKLDGDDDCVIVTPKFVEELAKPRPLCESAKVKVLFKEEMEIDNRVFIKSVEHTVSLQVTETSLVPNMSPKRSEQGFHKTIQAIAARNHEVKIDNDVKGSAADDNSVVEILPNLPALCDHGAPRITSLVTNIGGSGQTVVNPNEVLDKITDNSGQAVVKPNEVLDKITDNSKYLDVTEAVVSGVDRVTSAISAIVSSAQAPASENEVAVLTTDKVLEASPVSSIPAPDAISDAVAMVTPTVEPVADMSKQDAMAAVADNAGQMQPTYGGEMPHLPAHSTMDCSFSLPATTEGIITEDQSSTLVSAPSDLDSLTVDTNLNLASSCHVVLSRLNQSLIQGPILVSQLGDVDELCSPPCRRVTPVPEEPDVSAPTPNVMPNELATPPIDVCEQNSSSSVDEEKSSEPLSFDMEPDVVSEPSTESAQDSPEIMEESLSPKQIHVKKHVRFDLPPSKNEEEHELAPSNLRRTSGRARRKLIESPPRRHSPRLSDRSDVSTSQLPEPGAGQPVLRSQTVRRKLAPVDLLHRYAATSSSTLIEPLADQTHPSTDAKCRPTTRWQAALAMDSANERLSSKLSKSKTEYCVTPPQKKARRGRPRKRPISVEVHSEVDERWVKEEAEGVPKQQADLGDETLKMLMANLDRRWNLAVPQVHQE